MSDTKPVISPAQCRAARGLVGISQSQLAAFSDVSEKTIADFERQMRVPYARTLRDLRAALERQGVVFVEENGEGPGVRVKKQPAAHGDVE